MTFSARVQDLATRVANHLRDNVAPRLLPAGGSLGQVLTKTGAGNYAAGWQTPSGGGGALVGFDAGTWQAPPIYPWQYDIAEWCPVAGATTAPGVKGLPAALISGTATARAVALTNALAREQRIGYASAATAGSVASFRFANAMLALGVGSLGGFFYEQVFGSSDAVAVANARQFVGIRALTGGATNVEPSTITNAIGVGSGEADSNLKVFYGGAAAQPAIDLGANFPSDTAGTEGYKLILYAPTDPGAAGFALGWYLKRLGTVHSASGVLSAAQLPTTATLMTINHFRTNNTTAAAVGLDLGGIYLAR